MPLLDQILAQVPNDECLFDTGTGIISSPLRDLIRRYNHEVQKNQALPDITEKTTGAELKVFIGKLDPEVQLDLLSQFSVATKNLQPLVYEVDPRSIARSNRIEWYKRTAIVFAAVLLCLIFGAGLAAGVINGVFTNIFASSFVKSELEIMRFIFSSPGPHK